MIGFSGVSKKRQGAYLSVTTVLSLRHALPAMCRLSGCQPSTMSVDLCGLLRPLSGFWRTWRLFFSLLGEGFADALYILVEPELEGLGFGMHAYESCGYLQRAFKDVFVAGGLVADGRHDFVGLGGVVEQFALLRDNE